MKYAGVVMMAMLASACSGTPTNPSAMAGGFGSTASTADDTPVRIPGVSEPNDAPQGWTFVLQGQQHPDFSQSVFFAWRPFEGVTKTEISCERFEVTNEWKAAPSLFVNNPTKLQANLPHGRWRCRARSVFGPGHNGTPLWTAYIGQAIHNPPSAEVVDLDACEWVEEAPAFWKLVRRFRS